MKILLLTGKLASKRVKEIAEKFNCDVYVAPVDVALFAKPEMLKIKESYDFMLIPGEMKNSEDFEKKTGIKTYLGTKNLEELELLLKNIDKIKDKLSKSMPACELLKQEIKKKAIAEIEKTKSEEYIREKLRYEWNILVGELPIGRDFPIRVLAEIVGAEKLSNEEILKKAKYFKSSGADIIDLGFGKENAERVREAIELLRKHGISPISIDTNEIENIRAAIEAKVDLILSFDREMLEEFRNIEIPSVIVPSMKNVPKNPEKRLALLEENINYAKKRGFKKIIADPILNPLNHGLVESIIAYKKFSEKYTLPLLMGVGNVTELLDADSIGVNALLCGIASECNVSIVFTPEHSDKAKGSVRELSLASKMMFLSKKRNSPPKDLGIDLLLLKEKRIKREKFDAKIKNIIKAKRKHDYTPNTKGYFKIFVEDEKIVCIHFKNNKPTIIIEGTNAKEICDTIITLDLISSPEHAMYLGRELQRAEFAMRYGKSYIQD
ncbi:MAG: dihydropteroate synthase-like protein [Candidatus Hydrothermarchaeota archaeon]|nr:MAG: dihydropteroate synthase-like protein [Candidatus Hydrothermarchaeota archaeon]